MNVNTMHTHSSVCVLSIFHSLLLLISFVFVFDFTFVVVAVVRIFSRQTYTHTHSYKLVHCVEHDFSFSFYMPKYCFPPSYTIVSHMHTAVRSLLYEYVDDFYTGSHISLGLLQQLLFAISHSISQLQMKWKIQPKKRWARAKKVYRTLNILTTVHSTQHTAHSTQKPSTSKAHIAGARAVKICCALFQSACWLFIIAHLFFGAGVITSKKKLSGFIYYCTARRNKRVCIELAAPDKQPHFSIVVRTQSTISDSPTSVSFVSSISRKSFSFNQTTQKYSFLGFRFRNPVPVPIKINDLVW